MQQSEQLAAIDLGSNSFHMVVARRADGDIHILDSLSEKVQLGAGLDRHSCLDDASQQRALECLRRFAQRIVTVPRANVRVVGTNALRVARNAASFLHRVERLLGREIDIVAGREEARLIYLGVAHSLPDDPGRRLVIDIGGGSTELVVGERFTPLRTESLHMGCVSYAHRFFSDGRISALSFQRAVLAARQQVLLIGAAYRRLGWQQAVGASGTAKSIAQVCKYNGWNRDGETITSLALERLAHQVVQAGSVEALQIKGLRDDRRSIFAPGLAILSGIFRQFQLRKVVVARGALREGLLYEQLGRFTHEDIRERSIQEVMGRYRVDRQQARRVLESSAHLHRQAAAGWQLDDDAARNTLRWGALAHEIGLAVSHSQFHKHGAYLITNSDLPGFSRREQGEVALLVRAHRRKMPLAMLEQYPTDTRRRLVRLCLLLRLACRLHHARDQAPPAPRLEVADRTLLLTFPAGWLADYPLTRADLGEEKGHFEAVGYRLEVH